MKYGLPSGRATRWISSDLLHVPNVPRVPHVPKAPNAEVANVPDVPNAPVVTVLNVPDVPYVPNAPVLTEWNIFPDVVTLTVSQATRCRHSHRYVRSWNQARCNSLIVIPTGCNSVIVIQ